MSHLNESCQTWKSHVTCELVMWHMKESCVLCRRCLHSGHIRRRGTRWIRSTASLMSFLPPSSRYVLQCLAVCYNVLQCLAVCCSVSQCFGCVAVCCGVCQVHWWCVGCLSIEAIWCRLSSPIAMRCVFSCCHALCLVLLPIALLPCVAVFSVALCLLLLPCVAVFSVGSAICCCV